MVSTSRRPSLTRFLWASILLTVLVMLVFLVTRWLAVPSGQVLDWLIGVVSFWWLLAITTIPWNLYFAARETVTEVEAADLRHLDAHPHRSLTPPTAALPPQTITYVRRLVRRALIGAILLHLGSAAALYWLARSGISSVGYVSAVAALLLTGLRPALRGYEYVAQRLASIRHDIRYPREDVVTLKHQLNDLTEQVNGIARMLDRDSVDSWAAQRHATERRLRHDLDRHQSALRDHIATNQAEHRQLARDIEHAVAQISTDGKVLEHARELVRFFKNA